MQPDRRPALFQALDGQLAVDHGNDDVAMAGFQRTVDHQQVAFVDAGADHRVARRTARRRWRPCARSGVR